MDRLPADVQRPAYDRAQLRPGILHLGVGAFHRCHQAEWTDDALAAHFGAWGIVGVNLRAPDIESVLGEQDGYFCRITRSKGQDHRRLVGAIVDTVSVADAAADPDRAGLRKALEWAASPDIRVITMTVTEKGYCHIPATGELDTSHPDIVHDRENPAEPVSVPGFILRALALRLERGVPWPVVISCDNVPDNGGTLRRCVLSLARMVDPGLATTIADRAHILTAMVDRIVPATLDEDLEAFAAKTGIEDRGLVVGEPFRMWVIENPAGLELPAWDAAGALFVEDVAPYELLKMRVLNGIQSNLCQLGALSGLEFMADVMAIPVVKRFAERTIREEVIPCLGEVPGIDLEAYLAQSIERLTNPDLKHRTAQISTDGSLKIKQRLLEPIRAALAAGRPCDGLLLGVAGWMQFASGLNHRGDHMPVSDPLAAAARAAAESAGGDPARLVARMLDLEAVFGTDLRQNRSVVDTLVGFMTRLGAAPAVEVVRDVMASRRDEPVALPR